MKSSAYSHVKNPTPKRVITLRGLIGLILSILLPPVGLYILWRNGIFRKRGRMLISLISTAEMLLICLLMMPKSEDISTLHPATMVPPAVTTAPESDTMTALSNIEQIIYDQQVKEGIMTEQKQDVNVVTAEEQNAQREAMLETVVYSVFNNARFYHNSEQCDGQTNKRTLTLREAMQEGLGACPNCNPPKLTD